MGWGHDVGEVGDQLHKVLLPDAPVVDPVVYGRPFDPEMAGNCRF